MSTTVSLVTAQYCIDRAREEANMQLDQFVSDDELLVQLVPLVRELYDLLIEGGESYYNVQLPSFTLDATRQFTLPDDFYKLRGVDFYFTNRWIPLDEIPFANRNDFALWASYLPCGYQLFGRPSVTPGKQESYLQILPEQYAPTTGYRLWYVPKPAVPVNFADKIDGINGWERFVICGLAVYALRKKHILDRAQDLRQEQLAIEQRLRDAAAKRNIGQPAKVAITSSWNRGGYWGGPLLPRN